MGLGEVSGYEPCKGFLARFLKRGPTKAPMKEPLKEPPTKEPLWAWSVELSWFRHLVEHDQVGELLLDLQRGVGDAHRVQGVGSRAFGLLWRFRGELCIRLTANSGLKSLALSLGDWEFRVLA